mmetsp:Transcript_51066/g.143753  ORF Transcript_51066/g.143753 Transcript_51066/m.143753 type:complete len:488 (-) Transcript_51066:161-1624(-)
MVYNRSQNGEIARLGRVTETISLRVRAYTFCRNLPALVFGPRTPELCEALEGCPELLREEPLVVGVQLEGRLELLVPEHDHVGDEHHLVACLPFDRLARLLAVALDDELGERPALRGVEQRPALRVLPEDGALGRAVLPAPRLAHLERPLLQVAQAAARGLGGLEARHAPPGPVRARQRGQVQAALALEEHLAAGADDGDPAAALRLPADGLAVGAHGDDVHRQVLVEAADDRRGGVRALPDVHPVRDALVLAGLAPLGHHLRDLLRRPRLPRLLVLREVDVLALARRRPHLLRHVAAVGHLRVVADEDPLVPEHVGRVLVAEARRVLDPGAHVPGVLVVAAAVHVPTAYERDRLAVAEAHPAENLADVRGRLLPPVDPPLLVDIHAPRHAHLRVGEPARRYGLLLGGVGAAPAEVDLRAACVLDRAVRGEHPQVGERYAGELLLDRLEELPRRLEPRVAWVICFERVAHRGTVGTPSHISFAICAG